jgi:hypothetical protein
MCASPAQDYKYAPLILHDVVLSSLVRSLGFGQGMLCPCRWHGHMQHTTLTAASSDPAMCQTCWCSRPPTGDSPAELQHYGQDCAVNPPTKRKRCVQTSPCIVAQSPGRWYSYRVHGGRIMRFQAPPPAGRKEGFQFLVYGDMGDPDHRKAKAPGWVQSARLQHSQGLQSALAGCVRGLPRSAPIKPEEPVRSCACIPVWMLGPHPSRDPDQHAGLR